MAVYALAEIIDETIRKTRDLIKFILNRGNERYCPICQKSSKNFAKIGLDHREDARCLFCGSLERHRLTWLYFDRKTNLFDGRHKIMLHVAPEACFGKRLKKKLGSGYISADITSRSAMVKMDITNIRYPSDTFDVIYCSHVLEHVVDDKTAIQEFYRVLKPNGWAILLVPILSEKTFEDPRVTKPEERLRLFGQADHVRSYGFDYVERLRTAGFAVRIIKAVDFLTFDEIVRMGITNAAGELYYCTKNN